MTDFRKYWMECAKAAMPDALPQDDKVRAAMQGIAKTDGISMERVVALVAFDVADAMLQELKKRLGNPSRVEAMADVADGVARDAGLELTEGE